MPEGYTHIRTGEKALLKSGLFIYDRGAFCAGAQGPDPLFFYSVWKNKGKSEINKLASLLHTKKTGEFLLFLIERSKSPILKSFTLGFLTHYATDKNAHPYVKFLTEPGAPYDMKNGHGFYEIALDSELHDLDYGKRLVPAKHSTMYCDKAGIYEISTLLQVGLLKVYGIDVNIGDIFQSYFDMRFVRRILRSHIGLRRRLCKLIDKKIIKDEGYLLSHLTPAALVLPLPPSWKNPFADSSAPPVKGGIDECLTKAANEGAELLRATEAYWKKNITKDELSEKIGNKSYESNLEAEE